MYKIRMDREWAMPNKNTFDIKPIKAMIEEEMTDGVWVDPYANKNKMATITNDLNPEFDTDYHLDAQEFLKMLDSNSADGVLWDPPYCYDGDTEVFTKKGWKNIKEITMDDIIATLNTETNLLEYHKPVEVIKKRYKGEMISVNSQSIKLLMTPNHRCWVKDSFYGDFHWVFAKDLSNLKRRWFKKACDFKGEEKEFFDLPAVEFKGKSHNRYGETCKPIKKIPMDLWLKFLGLYLSEGSYKKNFKKENDRHYRYTVCISQQKPEGRKKIEEVLDELGYKYSKSSVDYRIDDKQLWTYVSQFGGSYDKFIPEEIKSLSSRQLQILIDYLMIGDGTNIKYPRLNKNVNKMYHYTTNHYATASTKLRDDFSEIAIKAGYGISISVKKKEGHNNVSSIHMLKAKDFKVEADKIEVVKDFNDYVYCITVPNSTLLVKKGCSICWCGNSPRQIKECYDSLEKSVSWTNTSAAFWGNQKKEISRIVKVGGKVITFGWNSGGIGKKYGFEITRILMVAHGGWHNDTICTVEEKVREVNL